MEDSDIIAAGGEVLLREAKSIERAKERLGENFAKAVKTILLHNGKLLVCGLGKSGLVGQKIAATLSSTGTPAVFIHACDAVHGDLGVYQPGDPTMLISNSGATVECLRLLPILKKFNSPTIALVGNAESPMARECDIFLDASSGGEADPLGIVPTNSTTLALAYGDALACALMKARGFSKSDFAKFHPAGQLGRSLLLKTSDIMHPLPQCAVVSANDGVRDVVIEMTGKPLGAACVVDNQGRIEGIITDGDLRRRLKENKSLDLTKAADIMTKNPVCVECCAPIGHAASLMENRPSKISVLPVVGDGSTLLGLVRIHDIYQPM